MLTEHVLNDQRVAPAPAPPQAARRSLAARVAGLRELVRAAQIVGVRDLMRLGRAQRLAWPGMMNGFYATRIMQTLFNVGFFDELQRKGTIEPAAFAASSGLDPSILRSLCEALYAMRILDRRGAEYRLSPDGRLLVEVGRGWFDGVYGYEGVFHRLEALLRGQERYGEGVFRRADFVAKGSGEIENRLYFPIAIDAIRRGGHRRVLDLGCGEGTFLRRLCERAPEVTAYGIDLAPEAIADGIATAAAEGLQDRVHLYVHDMVKLESVPESLRQIDYATVFFVLHEILFLGTDALIEFLRSFRRLFPRVPLMAFEVDRPTADDMRQRPGMAIPYFLQHDLSRQRPIPKEEWPALFRAAGFEHIERRDLPFARSVIFTVR
jgi:SAM-dependent methyltransferase